MEVTLVQEYTIKLPEEYSNLTKEQIMGKLESMYDLHGSEITKVTSAEYVGTTVTYFDDERVFAIDTENGQIIEISGYDCTLDGQPYTWKGYSDV